MVLLALAGMLLAGASLAFAAGGMRSEKLGRNLCETTGGAKIVPIPGFPGERIDRRLLDDIALLQRRYKILITDGYSNDPVHSANGEHPMGLALDILPDTAAGGSWRTITALAERAEPTQNLPVAPFRWVGYDGDSGHGRGNHLHLSWNHSETRAGTSPASVSTLRCPGSSKPGGGGGGGGEPSNPTPTPTPTGGSGGGGGGGGNGGPSGGIEPGGGGSSGGLGASRSGFAPDPDAPVVETAGVGLR